MFEKSGKASKGTKLEQLYSICLNQYFYNFQFELEMQKVHHSHEELIQSSLKKEKLERAIRYKLEIELRRLQEQNQNLKRELLTEISNHNFKFFLLEQFDLNKSSQNYEDRDLLDSKKEINQRDALIARLLNQSKLSRFILYNIEFIFVSDL